MKLIGPKNDPPTAVQEKVLSLIQSWADAFKSQQDLNGVVQVYQDLLAKGIEFPPTDLDAMAPIHTPQRVIEKIYNQYFFFLISCDRVLKMKGRLHRIPRR